MGSTAGLLTALAVARVQVTRFLRRRETFWLVLVVLSPCLLAGVLVTRAPSPVPIGLGLRVVACLGLVPLAYYLAYRAVASEVDAGSFVLLRQGPARLGAVHLGYAAAVAAELAWLLAAYLVIPFGLLAAAGATPGRILVAPLGALAFSLGFVPEGMLLGFVHRAGSRTAYMALRVSSLARLALLLALLELAIPAQMRDAGTHLPELAQACLAVAMGMVDMDSSWLSEVPLRLLLCTQLVTTLPYVILLPRRP